MKLLDKCVSFGYLVGHSIMHSNNNHDTTAALAMMVPHGNRQRLPADNPLLSSASPHDRYPVFWKSRSSLAFSPPSPSLFRHTATTTTTTTTSTRREMQHNCDHDDKDDNQHPFLFSKSPFESFENSVQQRIDIAEHHTNYQDNYCRNKQQHSIPSMIVTMSTLLSAANSIDPPIMQGRIATNGSGEENQTTTIKDNYPPHTTSTNHHHTRTSRNTNITTDGDLVNTCSTSNSTSTTKLTKHDIVSIMQQNGGCLVIQLEDNATSNKNDPHDTSLHPHLQIIRDMWACTTMFHHLKKDPTITAEEEAATTTAQSIGMRHQALEGSNTANQSQGGGYAHVETRIQRSDGTMIGLPPKYVASNNNSNSNDVTGLGSSKLLQSGITESYQLLSSIGKLVGSIGLSSSLISSTTIPQHDDNDIDLDRKAHHMVNLFCDDGTDIGFENETDESCSVHRLCQYGTTATSTKGAPDNKDIKKKNSNDDDGGERVENLRSHTDWTLVTLVPVSTIVGLEIWNPFIQCWITPERIAKEHYYQNRNVESATTTDHYTHQDQNTTTNNNNHDTNWNSNYIVVMGGKWLELLTQGTIQSAVHRVVTRPKRHRLHQEQGQQQKEGRLSAPFFLRPRQKIPMDLQSYYGVNATRYNSNEHGSSNNMDYPRPDNGNDYMKVLHDFLIDSCSVCLM